MKRKFFRRLMVSTLLMLLALGATAGLGAWQYTVAYRNDVVNTVAARAAVDLSKVSKVGEYLAESNYGQAVTVSGFLDCSAAFAVDFDSTRAAWDVCKLNLADGTAVAVAFAEAPSGLAEETKVNGRIQPAHSVTAMPARYEVAASVPAINTDDLVLRWQQNVHDGYIAATQIEAAPNAKLLTESLFTWPPVGIQMRNLFYAWQWWIFAGFTVFLWAKFTLDDYRELISNPRRNES